MKFEKYVEPTKSIVKIEIQENTQEQVKVQSFHENQLPQNIKVKTEIGEDSNMNKQKLAKLTVKHFLEQCLSSTN